MILASLSEVFSLGAVMPFLGVISAPEKFMQSPVFIDIFKLLGIYTSQDLLLGSTALFIFAALFSGVVRLILLHFNSRLSFASGADISAQIYSRTLYQPYDVHIASNSSDLINSISFKTDGIIFNVIWPTCNLLTNVVILIFILSTLIYVDPFLAFFSFLGFGSLYFFIIKLTRAKIIENGNSIARESAKVIKLLQEGLGGIRDILIDGSQVTYINIYKNSDRTLRQSQGFNFFIGQSPRFIMEALGMALIASLAYKVSNQSENFSQIIPILGVFALGAQRLLPILQQSFNAWSNMQSNKKSLEDVLNFLNRPINKNLINNKSNKINFRNKIELKNVSFSYKSSDLVVLNKINLNIHKGSCVGFVGKTGSGKSTLLDILMGLLSPSGGYIKIDNKRIDKFNNHLWRKCIAHVPQSIYLSDTTIEENIAFGIQKDLINFNLVRESAMKAQIGQEIESWKDGYQTLVGERGVKLSGGQKQRIGIARALYKNAEIIIFDEATSALDVTTEKSVMNSLKKLNDDLTIIMVAHRTSTLKDCDFIYEIDKGTLKLKSYKK